MLAASFTNLGEIISGSVAFFELKDFMVLFMSLGLDFVKSKFSKLLKVSVILTTLG